MLQDDLRDPPGQIDALDDVIAGLRMDLEELVFERRQLAGFVQDLGRYVNLAGVVEGSRDEKVFDPLFAETDLVSDCSRSFATRR